MLGGYYQASEPAKQWSVIVSGDTLGYLSPCGCTDPMSGGIRRRASVAKAVQGARLLFLDNGSLTKEIGRQSEMKAETMAEALKSAGVDAINLTSLDAQLGKGSILSVSRLSGEKLVATQVPEGNELNLKRWTVEGPFLIGGFTTKPESLTANLGVSARDLDAAAGEFALQALSMGKTPVVLLEGGQDDARVLARAFPSLRLIVYQTTGDPPLEPLREGDALLVTPGDRGRSILRMSFGTSFTGYQSQSLGPEHPDDPGVSAVYATYLKRVSGSDLLERVPRAKDDAFAGNKSCVSCHAVAGDVWKKSAHSHALETLEKEGHARDPDCVSCHVVGLTSDTGFRSRQITPELTDVGCESCHGPGQAHSLKPTLERMAKVAAKSCMPCHTPENSPRFDYAAYWAKIKH